MAISRVSRLLGSAPSAPAPPPCGNPPEACPPPDESISHILKDLLGAFCEEAAPIQGQVCGAGRIQPGSDQPCSPTPPAVGDASPLLPGTCGAQSTHTTITVMAHQRLDRGLFFHNGCVRWTWVMDMNTEKKQRGVAPCCLHMPMPMPMFLAAMQGKEGAPSLSWLWHQALASSQGS